MIISKEIGIDMGHRIPNHKSKCKNLHGHFYRVEVGVDDRVITRRGSSSEGMVIDYSDLKEIMLKVIDEKFDHGFMVYNHDPLVKVFLKEEVFKGMKICIVDFIPTAENISKFWFKLLKTELKRVNIRIKYVKVWETPTSMAMYNGVENGR